MCSLSTNDPRPLPGALSNPSDLIAFSEVKLIAFDLDGTLISTPSQMLGERVKSLFNLLSGPSRNIRLTLATGRTLTGVKPTLTQLGGIKKVPLVLYNGAVVVEPESEGVFARTLIAKSSVDEIVRVVSLLRGVSLFLYAVDSDAKLANDESTIEGVFYLGDLSRMPEKDFNGMPVKPYTEIRLSTDEVVAALLTASSTEEKLRLSAALSDIPGISITSSGSTYIEIRPEFSSKARGLEILCNRYRISADNVLAVGDNDNDVELLSWAGLSVCVKNSSAAARSASKFYSNHGAGNAAIEVLEIVRRAQRLFGKARKA